MAEQLDISLVKRQRLGKNGSETLQLIHQAYGDDAMRRAAVSKWWKRFRDGETKVKGQNRLFHHPPELAANGLQHVFKKGWSVVRCASLAKGGTSKNRPSPHLHEVPTLMR
jgi:hypothetical protein